MKTPNQLNEELFKIRMGAIEGIYSLTAKIKKQYTFKEGCYAQVETDDGSFYTNLTSIVKTNDVIGFKSEGGEHFSFGDFSTEGIVYLYEHLSFDIHQR